MKTSPASKEFTRDCLMDALLQLMQKQDYNSISITDLTSRAGVSRMSYYRHYKSKDDILIDYMYRIVREYAAEFSGSSFLSDCTAAQCNKKTPPGQEAPTVVRWGHPWTLWKGDIAMPQVYDTCFLFGAGPFFGLPVPPQPGDLILAADGGYRHCQAAGLRPDLLLGDLDSLETPPPAHPRRGRTGHDRGDPEHMVRRAAVLPQALPGQTFPAEKDDTDTIWP